MLPYLFRSGSLPIVASARWEEHSTSIMGFAPLLHRFTDVGHAVRTRLLITQSLMGVRYVSELFAKYWWHNLLGLIYPGCSTYSIRVCDSGTSWWGSLARG